MNENKLVKFYEKLLEAVGMKIGENKQVLIDNNGVLKPLLIDKLPVYLPTDEANKTAVQIVSGKPTVVKAIFNPLEENAVKGDNKSFLKLKSMLELKLLGYIYTIGEVLYGLFSDKDANIDNMELIKFVTVLNKYKTPGVKQLVDEKTVKYWADLYEKIIYEYNNKFYVKFYIKRGGKIGDVKYNRVGVITSPFVEDLRAHNPKSGDFLGVKIRNKDIHSYISLFEQIFNTDVESIEKGLQFGSLNKIAPATHVLLTMYETLIDNMIPLARALVESGVDDDTALRLNIKKLPFDIINLGDMIDDLEAEIKRVPKEDNLLLAANNQNHSGNAMNAQSQNTTTTSSGSGSFWDRVKQNKPQPVAQVPLQPVMQVPVQQAAVQQAPIAYNPQTTPTPASAPVMRNNPTVQPVMQAPVQAPMQVVQNTIPMRVSPIVDDPWSQPTQMQQGYGYGLPRY